MFTWVTFTTAAEADMLPVYQQLSKSQLFLHCPPQKGHPTQVSHKGRQLLHPQQANMWYQQLTRLFSDGTSLKNKYIM